MTFPRSSGILLHPTSLPGPDGIGDFGPAAYRFLDFLQASGVNLWQVLPLNPTGYGDSPFQCFSASAGNPLLISLERLADQGVLDAADIKFSSPGPADQVDYQSVIEFKFPLLEKAAKQFLTSAAAADRRRFQGFCQANADWLDNFALFMAIKGSHGNVAWTHWPQPLSSRAPDALSEAQQGLAQAIERIKYWQFEFFQQWQDLRTYARERGVRIIGDIPIYIAHDSADVWANRELFWLDEKGNPEKIAGVPPDYFSATGQCWGNPIYNWELLKKTGYRWWIARFRSALRLYDIARIDHFRGFEAYWEVPGNATTAVNGKWVKGPGADLFNVLQTEFHELPIIAENLGVITPEVEALRRQFGFPGMAILQFAFGNDPQAHTFRPHNYVRDLVVYTGTHDNDTVEGWWASKGTDDSIRTPEDVAKEHAYARAYLGFNDEPIHQVLVREVLSSVANTAIIPLQDILGLGREARMNLPGTSRGNWKWRCLPNALTPTLAASLRRLVELYER